MWAAILLMFDWWSLWSKLKNKSEDIYSSTYVNGAINADFVNTTANVSNVKHKHLLVGSGPHPGQVADTHRIVKIPIFFFITFITITNNNFIHIIHYSIRTLIKTTDYSNRTLFNTYSIHYFSSSSFFFKFPALKTSHHFLNSDIFCACHQFFVTCNCTFIKISQSFIISSLVWYNFKIF